MKTLAVLLGACALLVVGVTTSGADNRGTTIKHLRAQVRQLTQQRDSARFARDDARDSLKVARANLKVSKAAEATTTAALAVEITKSDAAGSSAAALATQLANTQALLGQQAAQQIPGLTPDQVWALVPVVFTYLPDQGLCGYDPSFYTSGNYASYTFTRYVC